MREVGWVDLGGAGRRMADTSPTGPERAHGKHGRSAIRGSCQGLTAAKTPSGRDRTGATVVPRQNADYCNSTVRNEPN